MKLEHPNAKECYLPLEVQVYEDLQKSERSFFFIHIAFFQTYFFQEPKTCWTKVLQTFMTMVYIKEKER